MFYSSYPGMLYVSADKKTAVYYEINKKLVFGFEVIDEDILKCNFICVRKKIFSSYSDYKTAHGPFKINTSARKIIYDYFGFTATII